MEFVNALAVFESDAAPALLFRSEWTVGSWVVALCLGCAVRYWFKPRRCWYAYACFGLSLTAAHRALAIPRDVLALSLVPAAVQRRVGVPKRAALALLHSCGVAEVLFLATTAGDALAASAVWDVIMGARYLASAPSWPGVALRALFLLWWRCMDEGFGVLALAALCASVRFDHSGVPERVVYCLASWILTLLVGDEWLPCALSVLAIAEALFP